MLVLQSFTLMDRQDAHTVGRVALNGLAADGLVPLTDEVVDVARVVLCETVQLVVEGT